MKKWKAITLLTVLSLVLVFCVTMTFARFPIGVKDYNSVIGAIDLDYDMAGGVTYTLSLADDNDKEVKDVNEVIETLSDRMNKLGYAEYSITALKPVETGVAEEDLEYDIRISAKSTESLATDIATVAAFGTVEFFAGNSANPTEEILDGVEAIESATYAGSYKDTSEQTVYQVALKFTQSAYDVINKGLEDATTNSSSYYMSITLGETTLLEGSSALSKDYFSERTIYIQSASEANAKQLALQLSTGGLEYKYELSEPLEITSTLGARNDLYSVIAVFAVILVAVVMFIVKFKTYGISAAYTLVTFIIAECAMMIAVPGIVFSIGGVLGCVLASILCIDGLTITLKRIEEESLSGKTQKSAIRVGYKKSLLPIINVSVIAGVSALILFALSTGVIKTFAIALGIGAVLSFLCNTLISRLFVIIISSLTKKKAEGKENDVKEAEGK